MNTDTETTENERYRQSIATALAAISICESLMLVLIEKDLINAEEADGVIRAAIESHLRAEPTALTAEDHNNAARLMERILAGSNAIRAAAHL